MSCPSGVVDLTVSERQTLREILQFWIETYESTDSFSDVCLEFRSRRSSLSYNDRHPFSVGVSVDLKVLRHLERFLRNHISHLKPRTEEKSEEVIRIIVKICEAL